MRKAGNKIRVTAQLIEVATDTHLWSETYTRELDGEVSSGAAQHEWQGKKQSCR